MSLPPYAVGGGGRLPYFVCMPLYGFCKDKSQYWVCTWLSPRLHQVASDPVVKEGALGWSKGQSWAAGHVQMFCPQLWSGPQQPCQSLFSRLRNTLWVLLLIRGRFACHHRAKSRSLCCETQCLMALHRDLEEPLSAC